MEIILKTLEKDIDRSLEAKGSIAYVAKSNDERKKGYERN